MERSMSVGGARQSSRYGDLAGIIAAAAIVVVLGVAQYLHARDSFLQNDAVSQFYPVYKALGASILDGYWPYLTLQSIQGGNQLGGYQYGIMNPGVLAFSAVLSTISRPYVGGAVFVIGHMAVLAAGFCVLARACGVRRQWAVLGAVLAGTNNVLFYLNGGSWWPGMVGNAWLPWAAAGVITCHRSRWHFIGATIAVALVVGGGWHYTTLAMALLGAIVAGARLWFGERRAALLVLAACALGAAMVFPTILALASLAAGTHRGLELRSEGWAQFGLSEILNLSQPNYRAFVLHFPGYRLYDVPVSYVGWFVLPLLPLIAWSRDFFKDKAVVIFGAFTVVLLLLSQLPSLMGPLRDHVRILVPAQIGLVLLAVMAYARFGWRTDLKARHVAVAIAILLVGAYLAWSNEPTKWRRTLTIAGLTTVGVTLAYMLVRRSAFAAAFAVIAAGCVVALAFQRITYPTYFGPASWGGMPRKIAERPADLAAVPRAYSYLVDTWGGPVEVDRFREIGVGNMNLLYGRATIGGYDSIERSAFVAATCMRDVGLPDERGCAIDTPRWPVPSLAQPAPDLGVSLLDLMRVDTLHTYLPSTAQAIANLLGPSWTLANHRHSQSLKRELAAKLPGTVSYASPGLKIEEARPASVSRETYRIDASGVAAPQLVWARMVWPGYQVLLDGKPLEMVPRNGFLVAAHLPANARGELTLVYRPKALTVGGAVSVFAVLVVLGIVVFWRRLAGDTKAA